MWVDFRYFLGVRLIFIQSLEIRSPFIDQYNQLAGISPYLYDIDGKIFSLLSLNLF